MHTKRDTDPAVFWTYSLQEKCQRRLVYEMKELSVVGTPFSKRIPPHMSYLPGEIPLQVRHG